jgi:NTP pyrophosphatase (non-canonical NTP hydrolase)
MRMSDQTVTINFNAVTREVRECNVVHGWYDDERTVGDLLALLHSEVSEMLDAYRKHGFDYAQKDGKPENVASEAADVFIRLIDFCDRYNIDLGSAYRKKMDYNWTRSYRHGNKRL